MDRRRGFERPSSVPSARRHADARLIASLCGRRVEEAVEDEFQRTAMTDSSGRAKKMPRLEWVVEHAFRVAGADALKALDQLATSEFNDLHRTFAEHLAQPGARHFTVNVDACIEHAAAATGLGSVRPLHLHGSISGSEEPVVRTGQLGVGLTAAHRNAVRSTLRATQLLVFIGYSGRDYFDIDPFFLEWAGEGRGLEQLQVVWVRHCEQPLAERDWRGAAGLDGIKILDSLETLGADCHYLEGRTRDFVRDLAAVTGLVAPAPAPSTQQLTTSATSQPQAPESVRRWIIEGTLWWSMGHGGQLVDLDRRIPRSPQPDAVARALLEARWVGYRNVGLYDESLALLDAVEPRWHRLSMLASDLELRGNRWRAGLLYAKALELSGVSDDGGDGYHHAIDARHGYVHWWSRARRTALGWPLLGLAHLGIRAIGRRVAAIEAVDPLRAYEQFSQAERYFDDHPHAVNQLAGLRKRWPRLGRLELPEHLTRRARPSRDVFVETDHFLGYINDERADLIKGLAAGRLTAVELARHRQRTEQICDRPGELKAALLQRAIGVTVDPPVEARENIQWAVSRRWGWWARWLLLTPLRADRSAIERRLATWLVQM